MSSSSKNKSNKSIPYGSIGTLVLECLVKATVTVLTGFAIRKFAYMWFYDPQQQYLKTSEETADLEGQHAQSGHTTNIKFVDSLSETCYNISSRVIRWLRK